MSYPTPDLASILQTLSSYAQVPQSHYYPPAQYAYQEQAPQPQYSYQEQTLPALEDGELPYEPPYEPTELPYEPPLAEAPYEPPYTQAETPYEPPEATAPLQQPPFTYEPQHPQQPPPQPHAQPQHHPSIQSAQQQPPKPALPSPSTITTWPPALRHVSFTLAQNQESMQRIKHLITTQHKHERQWWAQREALVKKQQGRAEERRKLDGVLSAVGGHIAPLTHVHDPTSEKAELGRFDRKVYKACQEMVAATMGELGSLGVPFFALRKELVGQGEGMIGDEALLELRMKMVGYLEDLCRD